MLEKLRKIWDLSWINTIRFNFHYLPLKQAIRLPFFLYNTEILCMEGKIVLEAKKIYAGMIRFGHRGVPLYSNQGFIFSNKGTILFHDNVYLGNGSALRCYPNAVLSFGSNFVATVGLKIECFSSIFFDKNVRIAWDVIIMDSSQHRLKNSEGVYSGKDVAPISIGRNTWIGTRSLVLKGTVLPNYSVVGAMACLNKDYSAYGEKALIVSSSTMICKRNGFWRDPCDSQDNISDEYWFCKK